jgi:hypothetical protein
MAGTAVRVEQVERVRVAPVAPAALRPAVLQAMSRSTATKPTPMDPTVFW